MIVNKIYSYIVAEDNGYSPNPFWGVLTLPWCKPTLRKAVAKYHADNPSGVWLVGLSRKDSAGFNRIIYLANIDEILTHEEYFQAYPQKHPQIHDDYAYIYHVGDNCYTFDKNETFEHRSIASVHSHDESMKKRDLSCPHVLISHQFIYYGTEAPILPENLEELRVGQGFKSTFSTETLLNFQHYLKTTITRPTCIMGAPHNWPHNDTSWKETIK